jgi:hypothetical protein
VAEPPPIDPLGILEVLLRHEVRFILIGAVAANIHGNPLPTEDVDITPEPGAPNYRRLAAALREMNARPRVGGERNAVTEPLTTDLGNLDIVTEPDGTAGFSDLRRDAIDVDLGDSLTVTVASLPDIIRSKEAAGRAKDQAALPALRATLERLEGREP